MNAAPKSALSVVNLDLHMRLNNAIESYIADYSKIGKPIPKDINDNIDKLRHVIVTTTQEHILDYNIREQVSRMWGWKQLLPWYWPDSSDLRVYINLTLIDINKDRTINKLLAGNIELSDKIIKINEQNSKDILTLKAKHSKEKQELISKSKVIKEELQLNLGQHEQEIHLLKASLQELHGAVHEGLFKREKELLQQNIAQLEHIRDLEAKLDGNSSQKKLGLLNNTPRETAIHSSLFAESKV